MTAPSALSRGSFEGEGGQRRLPTGVSADGRALFYFNEESADQEVRLLKGRLRLRQVTRLMDYGHQTPILTSRRDLPAAQVAHRMFNRWRQENFFKVRHEVA